MRSRSARVTACSFPLCVGVGTRIAGPSQAATLLSALGERDRALWAAAFYTGLRRGELRGLRWEDVDLTTGTIKVRRAWTVSPARFPQVRCGHEDGADHPAAA